MIGFGTDNLDKMDKETALSLMRTALKFSYSHNKLFLIDTAKIYKGSEKLVDDFVKIIYDTEPELLNHLLITIKIGISFESEKFFEQKKKNIRQHISDTQKNLEFISSLKDDKPKLICILHRMEMQNTEGEKNLMTDEKWINRFKVLAEYKNYFSGFGLSEVSYRQLDQAVSCAKVSGIIFDYLESAYSLFFRRIEENGIYNYCQKNNITLLSYTTLARGTISNTLYLHYNKLRTCLSGNELQEKIFDLLNITNPFYRQLDLFHPDNIINNFKKISEFYDVCKLWIKNPVQVAIAYVLKKKSFPVLSQSTMDHLIINLDCYSNFSLSDEEVSFLDNSFLNSCIKGDPNITKLSNICDDNLISQSHTLTI